MNRLRRNALGIAALCAVLGPWISTAVAREWYVSFFKEHKPLELQTDRIAVLEREADGVTAMVAAPAALIKVGIAEADIKPAAIHRWSKAQTPAGKRSAKDVQNLVRTLAATGDLEFVSPVFLDERKLPVHMTPHVLVRFEEGVTSDQAKAILAAAGAGVLTVGVVAMLVTSGSSSAKPVPYPEKRFYVEVKRVLSGHSAKLEPEGRLVYAGIRTPYKDEPFYEEAKRRNNQVRD
ncbi:MAG: hypothetical protein IH897_15740 [Planctomycetes bacterium]|nr:hypothetical protein [Planctomycetota bacterium]